MTTGPKYLNRLKGASRDWLGLERHHLLALYASCKARTQDATPDALTAYAEMAEIRSKLTEVSLELARRA